MERNEASFRRLRADKIDDVQVNRALGDIVRELLKDPELEDDSEVSEVLRSSDPPFVAARPPVGQFGIETTILISITSGLATAALKTAAAKVWDKYIFPELRRHLGSDIQEIPRDKDV